VIDGGMAKLANPFGGQLPPGWTWEESGANILVVDGEGRVVAEVKVDGTIPARTHLKYFWGRYHYSLGNGLRQKVRGLL